MNQVNLNVKFSLKMKDSYFLDDFYQSIILTKEKCKKHFNLLHVDSLSI